MSGKKADKDSDGIRTILAKALGHEPGLAFCGLGLVIAEAILLAGIATLKLGPPDQSLLVAGMVALPLLVVGLAAYTIRTRTSVTSSVVPPLVALEGRDLDLDNPEVLQKKVGELKDRLVEGKFLPDLIIGIARTGLVVAARLSKIFQGPPTGAQRIIPVISVFPHHGFKDSFNQIALKSEDFEPTSGRMLNILIVDDICMTGRTLEAARTHVEMHVDGKAFTVKTAAIYLYHAYSHMPAYFVDRITATVRDTSGNVE